MKKLLLFLMSCMVLQARAQLVVNQQLPPIGLVSKPQLWTMVLSNTSNETFYVHVEVTLNEVGTGNPVMSGVTSTIMLAPGSTPVSANSFNLIQYNILSAAYAIDANPNGLLPIGDFDACFSFFKHQGDAIQEIADQCQEIVIEPLGPPQLVYPYDQTAIQERTPQFNWLPPVPVNMFTHLTYDLTLVELYPNQSAADGIQQNIPLYSQSNIAAASLLYPGSAPQLEVDKQYAWRIVAKNNDVAVGNSETWQFSIKDFNKADSLQASHPPFVKMKKELEGGYAVFAGDIKFDYYNETGDSVWVCNVYDLSTPDRKKVPFSLEEYPLTLGNNLVSFNARDHSGFMNQHIYLLEIINSRNETWRLRFEYRAPQNSNNE